MEDYVEKMKVVYPRAEEELIDFLNKCKIKCSNVMLCPCCSAAFDKEATKDPGKYQALTTNKEWSRRQKKPVFFLQKRSFI